jgi:hypothetical protein
MRVYTFQVQGGQKPIGQIDDATDNDDFYAKLAAYEEKTGLKYVPKSIRCTISETMFVPDPTASDEIARAAAAE